MIVFLARIVGKQARALVARRRVRGRQSLHLQGCGFRLHGLPLRLAKALLFGSHGDIVAQSCNLCRPISQPRHANLALLSRFGRFCFRFVVRTAAFDYVRGIGCVLRQAQRAYFIGREFTPKFTLHLPADLLKGYGIGCDGGPPLAGPQGTKMCCRILALSTSLCGGHQSGFQRPIPKSGNAGRQDAGRNQATERHRAWTLAAGMLYSASAEDNRKPQVLCLPRAHRRRRQKSWAHNSAVECHPHTVEVVGSNPTAPTKRIARKA